MSLSIGQILAFAAASFSVVLAGMGSAKGVGMAGQTSAGVSSQNPEVSSKMMILQILPGTQGIYGFLIAVIIMINTGIFGGTIKAISLEQGLALMAAVIPVAVVGYFSAVHQANVASSGMLMTGEHPEMSGKAITMTVMVETYAVLALLASFLMVNAVKL